MVPFNDTSEMHHSAKASQPESTRHEGMLPFRARQVPMMSSLFRGMVVSSEDSVRRRLAELLRQSGLTPVLASTVADSQAALARDKVCMLLCDECLADGNYQAVVDIVKHAEFAEQLISLIRSQRTQDQQAFATWVESLRKQHETDFVSLRKDLETVATTTDDRIRAAQLKLLELTSLDSTSNH